MMELHHQRDTKQRTSAPPLRKTHKGAMQTLSWWKMDDAKITNSATASPVPESASVRPTSPAGDQGGKDVEEAKDDAPVIYAIAVESTPSEVLRQRRMSLVRGEPLARSGTTSGRRSSCAGSSASTTFRILHLNDPAIESLSNVHQSQRNSHNNSCTGLENSTAKLEEDLNTTVNARRLSAALAAAASPIHSAPHGDGTFSGICTPGSYKLGPSSPTSSFNWPMEDAAPRQLSTDNSVGSTSARRIKKVVQKKGQSPSTAQSSHGFYRTNSGSAQAITGLPSVQREWSPHSQDSPATFRVLNFASHPVSSPITKEVKPVGSLRHGEGGGRADGPARLTIAVPPHHHRERSSAVSSPSFWSAPGEDKRLTTASTESGSLADLPSSSAYSIMTTPKFGPKGVEGSHHKFFYQKIVGGKERTSPHRKAKRT